MDIELNKIDQDRINALHKKFLQQAETKILKKKAVYNKILAGESFNIQDIANLFNCKTATIRDWEFDKFIPKARKEVRTNIPQERWPRIWNLQEFHDLLFAVLNRDWKRYAFDREEIETIYKYVHSLLDTPIDTNNNSKSGFFNLRPTK